MLYKNLSGYFREKYGRRLTKICIDGGFTCPNRDGRCGEGGCIYCGERGAGEHIKPSDSIREQVERALGNAKDGELFVAYFQSFTNTYAPIDVLRERYEAALCDERIVALAIGTRPDCITEEIAELIAEFATRVDAWVELGLQTANDETAKIINRGYKTRVFDEAMEILNRYSIPVCVHLIVGLPGEGEDDVKRTVEHLGRFKLFGIKIHSIYVMRGTMLAEMYERGEYTPPSLEKYVRCAVYILTHISPDTVVHRLTGDCQRELLIAPEWNTDKHKIIALINKGLEEIKNG